MSAIRFLAADKLASWLAEVAASRQVLAPRQEGKAVVFRPLVAGETPSLARATVSPKAAVFPACETLVHFTGTKDPENPAKLNMKLDDTPDAPARMVFGCRSSKASSRTPTTRPAATTCWSSPGPATARAAPASATGPAAAPPIPPAPTCCSRP